MLQACLNGGRSKADHPSVPVSAAEIAADAAAARAAGAQELHIHPRNADGSESLAPEDVARCLENIRRKVPNIPIGVGTGAWIEPHLATRLKQIEAWEITPDYASVNLNETGAIDVIDALLAKGIGIEAGLWNTKDVRQFINLGLSGMCLRILIEMIFDDPADAEREYLACKTLLDDAGIAAPILLHGDGPSAWRMVELAARQGHDTRMGFEDCLLLPTRQAASSNSDLIVAAREIMLRGS
ncbi:MAG: 3-keto-5-aminohexanoate cleavage protein [Alphaproteobacteria bacterium]|nr:3-keto-5-aminohexanoate cleavage protein [Alphaproteobacteria bacterium]